MRLPGPVVVSGPAADLNDGHTARDRRVPVSGPLEVGMAPDKLRGFLAGVIVIPNRAYLHVIGLRLSPATPGQEAPATMQVGEWLYQRVWSRGSPTSS